MKHLNINSKAVFLLTSKIRVVATRRSGYRLDLTIETASKDALGETIWIPQDTYEYNRYGGLIGHSLDAQEQLLAITLYAAIEAGQEAEKELDRANQHIAGLEATP